MKNTTKHLAFIFGIFACALLYSEHCTAEENVLYTPRDYSIVPPAPTVGQFFKYKDYPVDYFHGVPEISFPLYTLKYGSMEVPITLSYHGGGIRVEHTDGNAGLGWTVSYGAQISHTLAGAPDDANLGSMHGLLHLNNDETQFRQKLIEKKADYDPTDGAGFMEKRSWEALLGQRYYNGMTDVANDRFSLYGLGLSADFVFDRKDKFSVSSEKPIKITKSNRLPEVSIEQAGCDSYGFLVEDQGGLSYYFTSQDRTRYSYIYGSPMLDQLENSLYYASAWHLDEIQDLSGNSIKYFYHPLSKQQFRDYGHTTTTYMSHDAYAQCIKASIPSVSSVQFYPQIPDSITAGGMKIRFEYFYENESTHHSSLIKAIKIEAEDGSSRVFSFKYSMVSVPVLRQVLDGDDIIYSFEYNEDYGFDFPRECQDFGGYFNNISQSGANLVPPVAHYGGEADRSVISDAAKNGVLTKIIYPTGGYSEFEWESHEMKYLGSSVFNGSLNSTKPIEKTVTDTLRMCLDDNYKKLSINHYKYGQGQQVKLNLTKYYNMNPANLYGTDYHSSHKFHIESYSASMPFNFPHVRIIRESDNHVMAVFALDKETIEDGMQPIPISGYLEYGKSYTIELVNPLSVSNSYDFLEANMRYGDSPSGRIYIEKIFYENIGTGINLWPGLRIKNIHSSTGSPDSGTDVYKWFFYDAGMNPNGSNGTVQILPEYDYRYYKMYSINEGPIGYGCDEAICVGETAFPGTTGQSVSAIEYPCVTTYLNRQYVDEPSELTNIVESYTYSSSQNSGNCDFNDTEFLGSQPIGSRMYTSRAFRRGNLLQKKAGAYTYNPETTVDYTYNIYEDDDSPVYTTDAFTVCDFTNATGVNSYGGYDYGIGTYRIIPYNKTVRSVTNTQKDGIAQVENYEYFYDGYTPKLDFNLVKTKTISGTEYGDVVYHYTYPKSGANYLPEPETEVITCGNTVLSAKRTEYDTATRLPLRVYELSEPAQKASLISASQATTASQRSLISTPGYQYRYNSSGNLIEIRYRDKVLASYLWGYKGMYPVIEALDTPYEILEAKATAANIPLVRTGDTSLRTQSEISQKAAKLRSTMPGTSVSSISYHWIFGAIEITDGRGVSTSYGYDSRGRLAETRDFNNFLISRHDYHYSNTPQND
ncbi:MAG: RHS repeat domain-containing protein [Muribaculaceae bacterium]